MTQLSWLPGIPPCSAEHAAWRLRLARRLLRSGVRFEVAEPVPLDRGPLARPRHVTKGLRI